MSDPLEPASERVAPEMLLHDEMRNAVGSHPRQPVVEKVVKCPLADSDRRIGDDAIESHVVVHPVGCCDGDPIGGIDRCGVGGGEPTRPLVDIDRPDSGVRRSQRGDAGDWSPATAEVEDGEVGRRERRCFLEEQFCAGIEMLGGEDTAVGSQGDGEVGQADLDGTRIRGDGRLVIEVLTGTHPVDGSGVGGG